MRYKINEGKIIRFFMNISDALILDVLRCALNLTPECVTSDTSAIMTRYGECLDGHLTDEEKIWSENIVTAWTNFAIDG